MIRTRFPAAAEPHFRNRALEVSRLEGFTDAAFGFAITLLVVSLEVPKTVQDLFQAMRGWPAFGVCFASLLQIWWLHNRFFRRYGLHDMTVFALNSILIFVVLLFVYPLKFLFTGAFKPGGLHMNPGEGRDMLSIYSGGLAATFVVLFLMHLHAWRLRARLELTPAERVMTIQSAAHSLCVCLFGLASITIAQLAPPRMIAWAGWVYFGIPAAMMLIGSYFGKRVRLAAQAADQSTDQTRIKISV